MVYILGVLQFILIAVVCLYEFKNKSSVVFMWATLLVMFGIMHLLSSLSGDIEYSNAVLSKASAFAILFCLLYLSTRWLFARKITAKHRNDMQYSVLAAALNEDRSSGIGYLCILILAIVAKIYPYLKYAGSILSTSWSLSRDYTATLGYLNANQLWVVLIYAMSGLAVFFWAKKERRLFLLTILVIAAEVIITRNRIEVLPLLCSIIAIFIFKNKNIRLSTVLGAAVAGIAVIYIVYGLRVFRHYGSVQVFLQNFELDEFISKINLYIATDNGELGLRRDFYYFIAHDNNFPNFGKAHSYIRMLLVYIPTQWSLGLKPDDFAIAMGSAIGMVAGGSTHPTLFGDCFANLGFFGIFLGIFWAGYATIMDKITIGRKRARYKVLIYGLNAVVYCIMGRGSIYNGFWFAAYGIPFLLLLEFLAIHVRFTVRKPARR